MPRPNGLRHLWTDYRKDELQREVCTCKRCGVVRTQRASSYLFQYPDGRHVRVEKSAGIPSCRRPNEGA